MTVPKMPEAYKAGEMTPCGYTKSIPRKWTQEEVDWIQHLKDKGYTAEEIADSVDRTPVSVSIKLKRLTKKHNTYNEAHKDEKYRTNAAYLEVLQPESVLDLYAGEKPYYTNAGITNVVTNDINQDFDTTLHQDALKVCCQEFLKGNKYDLVDLDPYGSAYDCLDLAIKIAKKGLVVTLGEMGQRRWRRMDYIRSHYGIETYEDFTEENLVKHIQQIGARNKKNLKVFALCKWTNIARVWFLIEPLKITEQWDEKPDSQLSLWEEV